MQNNLTPLSQAFQGSKTNRSSTKRHWSAGVVVGLCVLALSGCATNRGFGDNYRPIVDMKNVDQAKFNQDLFECQNYASQATSAGDGAVAGAVGGAVVGALFQAALGGSRNRGAAVGAVTGGLGGAASGEKSQRTVTMRCLQGRGYNVLG